MSWFNNLTKNNNSLTGTFRKKENFRTLHTEISA